MSTQSWFLYGYLLIVTRLQPNIQSWFLYGFLLFVNRPNLIPSHDFSMEFCYFIVNQLQPNTQRGPPCIKFDKHSVFMEFLSENFTHDATVIAQNSKHNGAQHQN